ncbi:MAG: hypothetical protein V9H26_09770 [Verrucomicrobiota bacterium]
MEIVANGSSEALLAKLKAHAPEEVQTESLTLEEIFVASNTLGSTKS